MVARAAVPARPVARRPSRPTAEAGRWDRSRGAARLRGRGPPVTARARHARGERRAPGPGRLGDRCPRPGPREPRGLHVAQRPDVAPADPARRDRHDRRPLGGARARGARGAARDDRGVDRRVSRDRGHRRMGPPADDPVQLLDPDGAAADRRRLPRGRDVRDRRDAEPDPLRRLPPPRRGLAAGVVPDRPEDRPLAFAAAVRPPLRAGRPPRDRRSRSRQASASSSIGCRSSTSPRSGCSPSRPRSSRRSTSASCASAGPTCRRSSMSGPSSTRSRTRSGRPSSSSRSSWDASASSGACCSASPTGGSWSSRRTARPRRRRPRATPTGSSAAPGSAARSCRSSTSTRRATRSSRSCCPTRETSSSRR